LRAPVIRDGKVVAVVSIVREPGSLHALMSAMQMPPAWYIAIINGQGHIVARSRNEGRFLGGLPGMQARQARARGGGGLYTAQAREGFLTQSAYWMSPATGWSVHIAVPKSVFDEPLRQMTAILAVGFGVCLLLALALVTLWITDFESRRAQAATIEQATRMDALGRLTGGVAHDFNNLLTVIQGNAELLSRRVQDSPGAERPLSSIRQASDRAAGLIRQLLVFARGGAAERTVVDLAQVIEETLVGMTQLAGEGVIIHAEIEEGVAPISADRLQLEAALLNLVANARDAMNGHGRVDISIRTRGGEAVVSVQDSGPGFDKAVLPRVFDPFFTTKAVGRGTGLGLSQVYGFVKGAGGRVEARNAPAGGAIVDLIFPAAKAPPPAPPPTARSAHPVEGQAQILLVDDNDAVRSTAAAFLRECDFAVAEAADGLEALQLLEHARVQAVVSDIVMPGRYDGIALAEVIAKQRPDLPILLVSGYSERATDAQALGFTVLHKPYDLPDLERRLRRLIDAASDVAV
jgi:signal transduction histidine kinase/CheY-like chemotaxis protein